MRNRLFAVAAVFAAATVADAQWSQFAGNSKHTGNATLIAQPLGHVMADVLHDRLAEWELSESGTLDLHYAVPLLDGDDVFMAFKDQQIDGPFFPTITWGVKRIRRENGKLVQK